jgi:hypothetical protein
LIDAIQMTRKKLFIVLGGIVAGIVLIVAIFVGLVVGIAFYSISNSQAADTARTFLKNNQKLKQEIGEVTDFGTFVTGSVNSQGGDGEATLYLKTIGDRKTVNTKVAMMYREGRAWRVTDASYENDAGQTVDLIEQYEPPAQDSHHQ